MQGRYEYFYKHDSGSVFTEKQRNGIYDINLFFLTFDIKFFQCYKFFSGELVDLAAYSVKADMSANRQL